MTNPLTARLDKLESKLPVPKPPGRVIGIVAGKHDTEAALALVGERLRSDDENSNDLLILRSIVSPEGQPAYSKSPYLLERGQR